MLVECHSACGCDRYIGLVFTALYRAWVVCESADFKHIALSYMHFGTEIYVLTIPTSLWMVWPAIPDPTLGKGKGLVCGVHPPMWYSWLQLCRSNKTHAHHHVTKHNYLHMYVCIHVGARRMWTHVYLHTIHCTCILGQKLHAFHMLDYELLCYFSTSQWAVYVTWLQWNTGTALSHEPYILEGGYAMWHLSYAVTCVGVYKKKPPPESSAKGTKQVVPSNNATSSSLDYPQFPTLRWVPCVWAWRLNSCVIHEYNCTL